MRQLLISLLVLVLAGCSGGPVADPSPSMTRIVHEPITAVVSSTEVRPVTLQVEPRSTCVIQGDTAHPRVVSPTGKLYLNLMSKGGRLDVHCTTPDGTSHVHPVNLSPVAGRSIVVREMPDGPMRPALTRDPMTYSNEELVAAGYPRRPTNPAHYNRWLADVMTPKVLAQPTIRTAPTKHGNMMTMAGLPESTKWTPNWSGYIMNGSGVYLEAYGTFTMSQVNDGWDAPGLQQCASNAIGGSQFSPGPACIFIIDSTPWVGIDGTKQGDPIVQAGIESIWQYFYEESFIPGLPSVPMVSGDFFWWTEYLPGDTQYPGGYPVSPGDKVFIDVAVTDSNGALDINGGYGSFYVSVTPADGSVGWTYYGLTGAPSGAPPMTGATAEWIMEKPLKTEWPFTNTWLDPLGRWDYASVSDVGAVTFRSSQDLTPAGLGSSKTVLMCTASGCGTDMTKLEASVQQLPRIDDGTPFLFWSWWNY